MIVLFIKSHLIRHQTMPGYDCPNCGKSGATDMELHQRYAEFATMTVYPKGVFGLVCCRHCGHTLPASRWTDDLHRTYVGLKGAYRTPVSYWKGAIRTAIGFGVGVVLLIGVLGVAGKIQRADMNRQRNAFAAAMSEPTPGITLASLTNGQSTYDVWRISRANGDTVWLTKYVGKRTLTNFYVETGWKALPDQDFSPEAVCYSATVFAKSGLKRIEDMADQTKPYEGTIFAVLDK